ncbi:Uma2 family endonuclease [Flavilitoribacter nigricans]|uniref:Putative restriction endonuclease domain-containing protein n=1 Tax=Flavilitoribacter nigricans (strain ATCC 23147 / DSM 23189 / NBRC 102662 / NCIMB 1420 / SS-2) TaxID=1122177 RepID=A0A2D0MYD1_FLAN2|nr:Uma2 family endonuclease [Flavilitoribacter nigricans]PHN01274.1 hypothetical protein CRP01_37990 [Flavilitoribacter nigricans DSM 23189 = NBRC 102662]
MTVSVKKRLLDVEEYQQMFVAGILTEDEHVELINGEILEMSPIGNQHAALVDRINNYLAHHLYEKAIVRVQSPIILDHHSEPEPDLSVLSWQDDFYRDKHPGAEAVILLIEVADSSLEYDREIKLPAYATAKIPMVWIFNIPESCMEIYEQPISGKYTHRQILRAGEQFYFPAFDWVIQVEKLLF